MKKVKKIMALGLAATLTFASMTGCSSKSDTNSGSNSDSGTASGTSDETFVIGGIGPLTGDAASYGISVKQGAEIAVKEINEAGGVKVGDKTMQLELKFEDDQATADKAVTAYNTLMDGGMNVLLGCVTTGSCLAVVDLAKEDNILMLTPSGSAAEITKNDNVFRLCFTDPLQGETMAEHMITDLHYKNIAVIYKNSDEYSTGVYEAFAAKVAELGGTITTAEAFADGEDFNTQLTSIKGTDAEAIFAPIYYNDAAHVVTQAADLSITLPFFGSDGWDGILDTVTDKATVEGATFLSPFFSGEETAADFVANYEKAYNTTPDQFAADGYDGVYVFKSALEQAKTTESADLISAMTQIKVDGLTGTGISFSATGEPQKAAKFIKIENGEYAAAK
ncbi:amino acid/amide ABC transporter substrate-binding protein (HAAT family) [Lachnotalea glycerini]|uniref:Amino acid/amide ABC transporter substrate-binding protein (HAAT family) n=1 Tax=Lachnotalea glycerini TaxID=1763509 RepID=A0A318EJE3_9FIRM|nr:ABC transporter substrate-binding protein [Lachnotalea glycerini]PXV87740.1 amino acid/amide ABC transporter substrate-binding protein (HAAT family) [Lachnotalea glycerini]